MAGLLLRISTERHGALPFAAVLPQAMSTHPFVSKALLCSSVSQGWTPTPLSLQTCLYPPSRLDGDDVELRMPPASDVYARLSS